MQDIYIPIDTAEPQAFRSIADEHSAGSGELNESVDRPAEITLPATLYINVAVISLLTFGAEMHSSLFSVAAAAFYALVAFGLGLAGLSLIQGAFTVHYKRRTKAWPAPF